MSSVSTRRLMPALSVVAVAVSLAACDGSSSSSSSSMLQSQAIDGYIVDGTVFCDGTENGATLAMGRLTCSEDTTLVKVSGGNDVGFNDDPTDDVPFIGQLLAPADLGFVTPLSSIAVAMSGGEDGFDAASFGGSVRTLGEVLGFDGLDLGADPADVSNVKLSALNAKVNQIITGFGATADDYATAGRAFADLVKSTGGAGGSIDTSADVKDIMEALNASLPEGLKLEQDELDAIVAQVSTVNSAIDAAPTPDAIGGEVAKSPVATPALTLERDETLVTYSADGSSSVTIDLDSFESDTLVAGSRYATTISGSGELSINEGGFTIDKSLTNKRVDLGFSLVATGDSGDARTLSIATTKARVDAEKGQSGSLVVTMPAGAEVFVGSTTKSGTRATAKITLKNEHSFALENGDVDVSFWRISDELKENGLNDITSERGNYRMTVAVGAVRIDEMDGGERKTATTRSVTAGNLTVNGPGFEGYVTVIPDAN